MIKKLVLAAIVALSVTGCASQSANDVAASTAITSAATTVSGSVAAVVAKVQTATMNACPGVVAKFPTLEAFTADASSVLGYPAVGNIVVTLEKDAATYCATKLAAAAAAIPAPAAPVSQ